MRQAGLVRRTHLGLALAAAIFLIAGCASNPRASGPIHLKNADSPAPSVWAGRISLQVQSPSEGVAAQSFAASFELTGQPERGELTLISPLGSVLGVMRWTPDSAVLDSGNGKLQRFSSVESFLAQTTGAAVPMTALFSWLNGRAQDVAGWTADLSRHSEGRVAARRTEPAPQADLRVVLDQ
jgi:outer membrane lipoprotein LolB